MLYGRISPFERTNWFVDWSRIDGARDCTVEEGGSLITATDFGKLRYEDNGHILIGMKL